MSDFTDAISEALAESIAFAGPTPFTIGDSDFTGDFSELGQESFVIVDGGRELIVSATLIAPLAQFGETPPKAGTRLKVKSRAWEIGQTATDEVSVTLQLVAADAH